MRCFQAIEKNDVLATSNLEVANCADVVSYKMQITFLVHSLDAN